MEPASTLPILLLAAWLAPLLSFTVIVFFGPVLQRTAAYVATLAIATSFVLSMTAFAIWISSHPPQDVAHHGAEHGGGAHGSEHHDEGGGHDDDAAHDDSHASSAGGLPVVAASFAGGGATAARFADDDGAEGEHDDAWEADGFGEEHASHADAGPVGAVFGSWYALGVFGDLRIEIGYYIDSLTICMFGMVTLIATCIHFFSIGYMGEELEEVTDHLVTMSDGSHLHRPGRFHRFFQYLSLFCFSMLGLVIAGNIAMVFVFWELVGICSYLLIGFYRERHSASTAANKAFITNRVGDFGMIIGLMALWGSLGTFAFGGEDGIFAAVRPESAEHELIVPDGMVLAAAQDEILNGTAATEAQLDDWREANYGYGLLVVAGLGIFCGCVGKSAQFPLHVWLPDAMEGPTPVSALIHAATMVAAGVYLVGRFFPVFTPEVLLVIAYIGGITLILAATIAITATDIKRVLAYSTVSQLGYMMLSLGIGGWLAGLLHLFTHAFFKALLFLCSGSVIYGCHHVQEMPRMGGLWRKMPWTAGTMLLGCLAIAGAGIPGIIGFSGYYSKDAIIAQAISFRNANPDHSILFFLAAGGAAITAFYMFRMWFLTFAGEPRDKEVYDHAHESPKVMYVPLVILSVFAVGVAWTVPFSSLSLSNLLEQSRPAGEAGIGVYWPSLAIPAEHLSHAVHGQATAIASATALGGFLFALLFYGVRVLNPDEARSQFAWVHRALMNKWYFDEIYQAILIRPVMIVSNIVAWVDKSIIDRFIHALARWTRGVSNLDDFIDRHFVDGVVNVVSNWIYSLGLLLRGVQGGSIRQYVMYIVVGTVALFLLITQFAGMTTAAG